MEHSAVWITYCPDLSSEQLEGLRRLANRRSHLLVSPYPDLLAPIVASARGRQLRLDSTEDPGSDRSSARSVPVSRRRSAAASVAALGRTAAVGRAEACPCRQASA